MMITYLINIIFKILIDDDSFILSLKYYIINVYDGRGFWSNKNHITM